MVPMKYQPLILMTRKYLTQSIYLIVISFFLVTLFACQKDETLNPTKEFYVNDFADAWSPATKNTILGESERLFDETEGIGEGGTQLVFTSILVENIEDIRTYDKTEIYRDWEIGENDMGILVLFFYQNDESSQTLREIQIEVGYRMEQFITPGKLIALTDNTINNPVYVDQEPMAIAHFLYEILTLIYVDIYDYESFNYDMDQYQVYLETYEENEDDPLIALLIALFISSDNDSWLTILITIGIVALLGGSFSFARHKGAGGSSGGAGIFRRKK
jgi:uncharacterized protein